jgi:hypothetical protein
MVLLLADVFCWAAWPGCLRCEVQCGYRLPIDESQLDAIDKSRPRSIAVDRVRQDRWLDAVTPLIHLHSGSTCNLSLHPDFTATII